MRVRDKNDAGWKRLGRPRYPDALTPRQQDVFELLATGLTNEEIALQLGITEDGVKYHVSQILLRLDVENRYEAASLYLRTERSGRLATWAPVMLLRKLPFAWPAKAAAGALLAATAVAIVVLAWGVLWTSTDTVTTTGCSVEQSAGSQPNCAPGVAQSGAVAGAISAISAGGDLTCALKGGGVWCWGGYYIEDGVIEGTLAPVVVPGLESGVSAMGVGWSDACAVKEGRVWCWPFYAPALRGGGGTPESFFPAVVVPGLTSGATAVSPSCAVKDGGVWCRDWPTDSDSAVFVAVPELASGVSAISAGYNLTCALKDGGAWCWGSNWGSRVGNQSTTGRIVPVAVSGLGSGANAISVGYDHSCAAKDGGVSCWGSNFARQLGNNGTGSPVPVAVSGLTSGVSAIRAGGGYSCALKDGGVWCWATTAKASSETATRRMSAV